MKEDDGSYPSLNPPKKKLVEKEIEEELDLELRHWREGIPWDQEDGDDIRGD